MMPKYQVLMLSTYHEDEYAIRTIRAGASAYLTKNSPTDLLISVIRRLANGGKYIDPELAEKLLFDLGPASKIPLHSTLSDREYDVLKLITAGVSLAEISPKTGIKRKNRKYLPRPHSGKNEYAEQCPANPLCNRT